MLLAIKKKKICCSEYMAAKWLSIWKDDFFLYEYKHLYIHIYKIIYIMYKYFIMYKYIYFFIYKSIYVFTFILPIQSKSSLENHLL